MRGLETDARIKELEGENRAMRSAVAQLARIVGLLRDAEVRAAIGPAALQPIDRAAEQAERALKPSASVSRTRSRTPTRSPTCPSTARS